MEKLLLLHGALGSKSQFRNLENSLKAHFEVYSINFLGHGAEGNLEVDFSVQGFTDQLLNWLVENNFSNVNIFGYSMGGYVALNLATQHPEKVNRIFTFATKFDWNETTAAKEVKMLDAEKIALKVPVFAADLASRHGQHNWKNVLRKTADMMLDLGRRNGTLSNLPQLEIPVLIGLGDRDIMVSLEETIAVYRTLKNAALIVFPNTQHPLEKIDTNRLSSEIQEFFSLN